MRLIPEPLPAAAPGSGAFLLKPTRSFRSRLPRKFQLTARTYSDPPTLAHRPGPNQSPAQECPDTKASHSADVACLIAFATPSTKPKPRQMLRPKPAATESISAMD